MGTPLTLSIQAGGKSSRMGQDKALMPFLGEPLIQRVFARCSYLADQVIITAIHLERYQFLDLPIYPDLMEGAGALGGIHTALHYAEHPLVAIVACDLPFVNPDLLAACCELMENPDLDAVIPASERGLEPLHAVYRRDTCLPAVGAALQAGKRRAISWHGAAAVHILPPHIVAKYDPEGLSFMNVNNAGEFAEAEKIARGDR